MPTEEAVTGYEKALGLGSGVLTDVLESARIERHGDVWAKRRVHVPAEFVTDGPEKSSCIDGSEGGAGYCDDVAGG